jgi:hypothetical protein
MKNKKPKTPIKEAYKKISEENIDKKFNHEKNEPTTTVKNCKNGKNLQQTHKTKTSQNPDKIKTTPILEEIKKMLKKKLF